MTSNRKRLQEFLINHYDLEELRALCFDLRVDYEDLSGDRKTTKVVELILRLGREKRLDELLIRLRETFPIPFQQKGIDELFGTFNDEDFGQESGAEEPPTWNDIREACDRNSQYYLAFLREKYDADVYVERKILREHVDRFLWDDDDARYLVLQGQSGMGKTGFLCNLDEDLRQRTTVACLTYDCAVLETLATEDCSFDLFECLARGILPEVNDYALDRLLDQVEKSREAVEQRRLVVIVDAINENKHMDQIIHMLLYLQRQDRPWIKVIISCRSQVWAHIAEQGKENRVPRRYFYRPPNVSRWCIDVPRFSPEEAKEAYVKYQEKYGFLPEGYECLSRSLRERLREPLLLWLASRLFKNKDIQEDIVASDLEVIPAYTDQILEGILLDDLAEIKKRAIRFLEATLPKLMVVKQSCRNVVPRSDIVMTEPDDQKWFDRFRWSGILEATQGDNIRFRYERFYDYYFGQHLQRLLEESGTKLDCKEATEETQESV